MERYLRLLGIPVKDYLAWAGLHTLQQWIDYNPRWTLQAWYDSVAEHQDQIQAQADGRWDAPVKRARRGAA